MIMTAHCLSFQMRSSLALLIMVVWLQYSASVLAICSTHNPVSAEVHRTPTSGGELVFEVVHRHHPKVLEEETQSHHYCKPTAVHTEGRRRSSLIQGSLERGAAREKWLNRRAREERLTPDESTRRSLTAEEGRAQTLAAAGGEYMVQMQMGTPPQPVLLMLDTGSGLTWVQCKQCVQCSPQQEPLFDASSSSSYSSVSCQSPSCGQASSQFQCNTLNNTCEYGVQYGLSSFSTGVVSTDKLQLVNRSGVGLSSFLFGCGLFNVGSFVGSSGLLGLSRSNISLPSQLAAHNPTLGRKFSVCFAGLAHNLSAAGFISFGNSTSIASEGKSQNGTDQQKAMVYTKFAATPLPTQFYYLGLEGISVDGALLPINASVFELDGVGNGGTVIDSGTTLTLFNPQAYAALRDAFRAAGAARGKLPKLLGVGFNSSGHEIDTCYQFGDHGVNSTLIGQWADESAVPSIALHFFGDLALVLSPGSVLFPFDNQGLYCLAFASTLSEFGINVIGNIQQQNLRIEYDLENSRIGFERVTACAL